MSIVLQVDMDAPIQVRQADILRQLADQVEAGEKGCEVKIDHRWPCVEEWMMRGRPGDWPFVDGPPKTYVDISVHPCEVRTVQAAVLP